MFFLILFVHAVGSKAYVEFRDLIRDWRPLCPLCLSRNLVLNGGYLRLLTILLLPEEAWVYRKKCPGCLQSFTLLPADVMPLHSYGQRLIAHRILACLDGIPLRSRLFYQQSGLVPTVSEGDSIEVGGRGRSWSDLLDSEGFAPSYQLFHYWRSKFSRRAQLWIPGLLIACILGGCDLRKRLGESLSDFRACPVDLHPVLLAAGLVGLLQEQPVRLSVASTLQLLCGSTSRSHKPLRAAGRPPPHCGGDLESSQLRADMERRSPL